MACSRITITFFFTQNYYNLGRPEAAQPRFCRDGRRNIRTDQGIKGPNCCSCLYRFLAALVTL
jgi:hypothetical protein